MSNILFDFEKNALKKAHQKNRLQDALLILRLTFDIYNF